jgi:hypothetical protein
MWFATVLYFLLAVLAGLVLFKLFQWLDDLIHRGGDTADFDFRIATFVWAIPSLFLAIIVGAVPCHLLMRWLLGDRFQDFILFGDLSQGFDSMKLAVVLSALLLIVVAIAVLFCFDYSTRIDDSGMDINSLFSLGTRHRDYSEVAEIRKVQSFKAPNGAIVRNEYYELEFDDGKTWSFRDNVFEGGDAKETEVFEYLSQRTGLRIVVDDPFPLGDTSQ